MKTGFVCTREVSLYERLAEMNTSGFCITNSSSANGVLRTEADVPNHSLVNKPARLVELSSQWNCSGRLSCHLHRHFKDNVVCLHDIGKCHNNFNCVHNLKSTRCSFQVNEKVPSVFPINLSLSLRGWISQLFSVSDSEEEKSKQGNALSDAQSCGFESFELEYDSQSALDGLHTYTMQPFKHIGGLSFGTEDPSEQIFGAKVAEMAITDLVSAIPSVDALQTLLYFDLLHNSDTSRAPESSDYFAHGGGISSFDCSKEAWSDCAGSAHCVTPDQLGSPDALASWLNDRLPSGISQWGTAPGTKQVANLWIELIEGEIVLEDAHPPKRTVHVASVKIKNEAGQMLVEAHQEMPDGSIRPRNRPLSEKMRPGEKVEAACFRGIFEELGCQLGAKNRVRVLPDSYRWKQEERESLSYPGLLTSYFIHSMDATVEDLPDTGFYTVEDEMVGWNAMETEQSGLNSCNGAATGVKKHFWRWVPQP